MDSGGFRLIGYLTIFFLLGGRRFRIRAVRDPAFGIYAGMEMHVAAATSLAPAVPSGGLALRKHFRLGNFTPRLFPEVGGGAPAGGGDGLAVSRFASTGFTAIAMIIMKGEAARRRLRARHAAAPPTRPTRAADGKMAASASPMYYPKIYKVKVDPHGDLRLTGYLWAIGPTLKTILEYDETVKKFPNPAAGNMTRTMDKLVAGALYPLRPVP